MNFWQEQREKLGISQRQMSIRLGVSNTQVGKWEADERIPSNPIPDLANAYETTEKVIEREIIAHRRRMEDRELQKAGR